MWNGSQSQLAGFQSITRVTFPLLLKAASGTNFGISAFGSIDAMMVVDQTGVVRQVSNSSTSSVNNAVALIDQLLQGDPPQIATATDAIDFGGPIQPGESLSTTLTIRNTGAGDLTVSGIASSLDAIVFGADSLTIPAGGSHDLALVLTPQADGELSGTVDLTTNDPNNGLLSIPVLSVTVRTLPSAISVLADEVDFGDVEVGRAASRTLTVRNEGEGVLQVSNVTSDLAGLSVSPASFGVAPGASQTLTIRYTPGSEGGFSGDLRILNNDPDLPAVSIFLQGTATIVLADPRTDFNADNRVDFGDFLLFVQAYESTDPAFDLNDTGQVDFGDFLIFLKSYSRPLP